MTEAEPQSWADMVRSIDKERKQLPWDPATTQPVQRVSNYVVSSNYCISIVIVLK